MKMKFYAALPLAFLTALFWYWSFPLLDLSWLAWIALVPALLALEGQGFRKGILAGFIISFAFNWLTLDWFGYFGWEPRLVGALHWGFFYSLFFGIWGWFTRIKPKVPSWPRLLLPPLLWVAMEWLKDNGILAFSWGILGYTQYKFKPLLQMVSVTGVFGISFLIVTLNSLTAQTITYMVKKSKESGRETGDKSPLGLKTIWNRLAGVLSTKCKNHSLSYGWIGFLMLFMTTVILGKSSIPMEARIGAYNEICKNPMRVGVAQPNIHVDLKNLTRYVLPSLEIAKAQTDRLAKAGVKLVVWPESIVRYLIPLKNQFTNQIIRHSASHNDVYLITGLLETEEDRFYNSAYLFGTDGEILGNYRKTHLVPLAEYNPMPEKYHKNELFALVGNYTHGKKPGIFQVEGKKLGILICFESMFDYLARREVNQGARVLVVITNDAWFRFSSVAKIHFIMGMYRAVENRVWLIQSANTGISGIIDPWGRPAAKTEIYQRTEISGTVYFENRNAIYTKAGNFLPVACLAGSILLIWGPFMLQWKEGKKPPSGDGEKEDRGESSKKSEKQNNNTKNKKKGTREKHSRKKS